MLSYFEYLIVTPEAFFRVEGIVFEQFLMDKWKLYSCSTWFIWEKWYINKAACLKSGWEGEIFQKSFSLPCQLMKKKKKQQLPLEIAGELCRAHSRKFSTVHRSPVHSKKDVSSASQWNQLLSLGDALGKFVPFWGWFSCSSESWYSPAGRSKRWCIYVILSVCPSVLSCCFSCFSKFRLPDWVRIRVPSHTHDINFSYWSEIGWTVARNPWHMWLKI